MLVFSSPLRLQSIVVWSQTSRQFNSLPPFIKQNQVKKRSGVTRNNTPLFLRNHTNTKSTKNDIDFDFQNEFSPPSTSEDPSRGETDFDRNPEFAEILGSCLDDPLKARSKMEERLRRKKNKILHTKTGSAEPIKVTFNKFDFSNSYIWFEFYNVPLENDVSLICDTIRSWHIVGRLGGCTSMNMQLSQSTFEKRPNYDAIQGANVTPSTFYNIGDFEIQDNLARVCYVGIKQLVFGGSEFENWKENLTSEYPEKERKMAGVGVGVTLEELKKKMADFAKERDWDQFHSPRNLLLALVGEVGELSEIFQWKGEVPRGLPDWKEEEKEHLGEELSDVLLYLVRLADVCGVDLGKAAMRKLEINAIKYPVKLCKGSSKKHTQMNADNNNNNNNNASGDGVTGSIYSDRGTGNSNGV
ncbi:unnamed protein product [Dovyalis caffra]|uniref:Uncharacterized protein n=1 Tax=Dovyalis caffra TaxID=77055 RepID=A0AAV1SGE5_9ROSI|nr:unnamed protein product [Dovyalis caffra]